MLDRQEPDKSKQAKLLTEHLEGQRTLSCTRKEPQQHLARKTNREIERQLATPKAEAHKHDHAMHAMAAQHVKNAGVIVTFAKRARAVVLATGVAPEAAVAIRSTTDTETTFADAIVVQE